MDRQYGQYSQYAVVLLLAELRRIEYTVDVIFGPTNTFL
jgi:hypothetical protein